MHERFLLLESCLKKAMVDLKSICLEEFEFRLLKHIVNPAEITVEALCRRDMSLCSADAALNFMLSQIDKIDNDFACALYKAIKTRVLQRRNIHTTVLKFLTTGNFEGPKTTAHEIKIEIVRLLRRFKQENLVLPEESVSEFAENQNKSLKEKLEEALEASKLMKKVNNTSLEDVVSKEMQMLSLEGGRGTYLQLIYDFLIIIPPTSVECERCFSTCGKICTKVKSSLSNELISALVFLRSYLTNKY